MPRPANNPPSTSDRVRQVSIPPNHRCHLVTARFAASSTRCIACWRPPPPRFEMASTTSGIGEDVTRCANLARLIARRKSTMSTASKWDEKSLSLITSLFHRRTPGNCSDAGCGADPRAIYGVTTSNISSGTRYVRTTDWMFCGVTAAYAASSIASGEPGPSKRARPSR